MATPTLESIRLESLNVTLDEMGAWHIDLSVAPYQHPTQAGRVKHIAAHFWETSIGCPVVSRRADGTLVIIDGQNRTLAMLTLGIESWDCLVYDGLSLADEARLYIRINGDRRRPSSYDVHWNAGMVAKDPRVLAISKVFKRFRIDMGPKAGKMVCGAPVAAFRLYRAQEADRDGGLVQVLDIGKRADWPTHFLEAPMLVGYSLFLQRHADHAAQLETETHPASVYRTAKAQRGANTMLRPGEVYQVLREALGVAEAATDDEDGDDD